VIKELAVWLCGRMNVSGFSPALVRGGNLQVGFRAQDAPVRCHAMIETGGSPNWYLAPLGQGEYMVQIVTRAADYQLARADAWTIFDRINGTAGWTVAPLSSGGQAYDVETIEALAFPQSLGGDEKGNFEFSTNYIFRAKKK
jgi:hypothetical protein